MVRIKYLNTKSTGILGVQDGANKVVPSGLYREERTFLL